MRRSASSLRYFGLALGLATALLTVFWTFSGISENQRSRLGDMVDGTAARPFVYRLLLPKVVGLLSRGTPDAVAEQLRSPAIKGFVSRFSGDPALDPVLGVYAMLLMLGCLVGYAYAMRTTLRAFNGPAFPAETGSLLALLAVLPFARFAYIYDPSTIFLSGLLLALAASRRWHWFQVAFLISCLNKETTFVFVLAFAVGAWGQLPRRLYWGYLALECLGWVAIRRAIVTAYADNLGSVVEYHLPYHLELYSKFTLSGAVSLIGIGLLVFLIRDGFDSKAPLLRRGLVMLGPIAPLYLLYGMPFEWRVFYEVHGLLVALALPSALNRVGIAVERVSLAHAESTAAPAPRHTSP
jgi:hypothetical protein